MTASFSPTLRLRTDRLARDVDAWARGRGTWFTDNADDLRLEHLLAVWRVLRNEGASRPVAAHWIGAVAGAPDALSFYALSDLVAERRHSGGVDWREWLSLGEVGPLAYAAGMTAVEARAGLKAGTLDRDGLEILAGLRGWAFPPLPRSARATPGWMNICGMWARRFTGLGVD